MNNKGIVPIATILLVLAGIAVLGGVFYYSYESAMSSDSAPVASSTPITNPTSTTPTPTSTPIVSPTSTAPYKAFMTPTSGGVGTVVTIHGSGFAATGNTVTFDGLVGGSMKNIASADGKTLTFTVPGTLGPNCKPDEACPQFLMVISNGRAYTVAVITGTITQTIGSFTVTSGGTSLNSVQ